MDSYSEQAGAAPAESPAVSGEVVPIEHAQWVRIARTIYEPNIEDEEWGFDGELDSES